MDAKDIAEYQMIYGSDPPFQKLAKAHLDLLEQNKWIPVSESSRKNRPPRGKDVLIVCVPIGTDGNPDDDQIVCTGAYFGGKWAIGDESAQGYMPNVLRVTHWKPLPNVPEDV